MKGIPTLPQGDLFVSRRQGTKVAGDIRVVSIRSRRKHGDLSSMPTAHGRVAEGLGLSRDYDTRDRSTEGEEGHESRDGPHKEAPLLTQNQEIHPSTNPEG